MLERLKRQLKDRRDRRLTYRALERLDARSLRDIGFEPSSDWRQAVLFPKNRR